MKKVRVLLVDDSLTVRKRLAEVLSGDPEIEIAGEADDGKEAIECCTGLRPDVITMDMMMPLMSGLAATEYIMAHCPTPILVVSSSTNRGDLYKTYDALAAGAVDVLDKSALENEADGEWNRRLLSTIKLVSRIRVITHPRARLGLFGRSAEPTEAKDQFVLGPVHPNGHNGDRRFGVIAVGASTGGPGALLEILRGLPPRLTIPILVVLHIGDPFAASFADWLQDNTRRRVSFARDGEPLAALSGRVVMAPPAHHMLLQGGRVCLNVAPKRHSCRPSVDVLFESVARECGPAAAACLLTGMGRDGASGLLEIRRAGGLTVAQDEATSVVYGMPREAALINAAERVLPLGEIAPMLGQLIHFGHESRTS